MTWQNFYHFPDPDLWKGRPDTPEGSAFFQIVKMWNLLHDGQIDKKQNTFALIGFCCDEGVRRNFGRIGASEGPRVLRCALARLPVHQQNFILYDIGDIVCNNNDLSGVQNALSEVISKLLSYKMIPIVIGGGHEVAWGHYQGIAKAFLQERLGIVNFDAHFDLRPPIQEQGTSGTPFAQIAQDCKKNGRNFDYNCIGIQPTGNIHQLFETAEKYNVKTLLAETLHQNPSDAHIDFIKRVLNENEYIYTTICLDVFAAAFAPGVSAPQPLGLTPWQVIFLLRVLSNSGKVVSYDLAELNSKYDIDDRTAKLAACLVSEIVHAHDFSKISKNLDCFHSKPHDMD